MTVGDPQHDEQEDEEEEENTREDIYNGCGETDRDIWKIHHCEPPKR